MVDNEDLTDEPLDFSADFDADKKVDEQKASAPLEECLHNGNDKAEECKNNVKIAAAVDDNKEGPRDASESESNFGPTIESDTELIDVPVAEFYDFDKDKREECFAVGQMWAMYGDDGMPRLYARIREVCSPGFKVLITWLDADPDDRDHIDWTREGLPVACGKFIREKSDKIEDIEIFSHRLVWEIGTSYASYRIYPQKGETWAIFKNWDIKWSSDPDKHRNFQYEFVEVLSDYTEESGITVAYLVKIKGFLSLFKPTINSGTASFQIPPNELLRFSHRVPSYRTTGTEREDVPEGYFELDPASLPSNLEEIYDPVDVKMNVSSRSSAEEKPHTLNQRTNPAEKNDLEGGNSKVGNGSPRLSNGCYKKPSEENAGHLLEMTSSGSDQMKSRDGSNGKEMGSDPASLPRNLEEISDPVDVQSIDTKINVSSRSLAEEKPHTPKKRKTPDEKNLLEGGDSKSRNGSPRLSNVGYRKKPTEENAGHPLEMTSSGSDQVSDGSDRKEMGPDLASLPSNVKEVSDPVDGEVNVENIDAKMNDSSGSPAEERPHKPKKRKYPDEKDTLDGSNSKSGKGSPWLSNGCYKKKPSGKNAGHPAEKISSGSYQMKRLEGSDAKGTGSDGLNNICYKSLSSGGMGVLIDTTSFSHQSRGVTTGKKHKYEIYPRKAEVWALHRNFNSEWSCSDLYNKCEYDMVEVLEVNVKMIKVLALIQIAGMKTVYKSKRKAGRKFILEIPRVELLRFSHQVPAFRLNEGRWRGCWELDPQGNSPFEGRLRNGNDKAEECKSIGNEAAEADHNKGLRSANESESNFGPKTKPEPEFLKVPNTDFYDFVMDKKEECFAVDQVWAVYDHLDRMPRFYALIRRIYSPGFKVQITLLEADPDDQDEIDWTREGLPVACGKFKHKKTEKIKDLSMFSHRVNWEKGTGIGSYRIYPRKGETWALFKNWDISWSSDPDNHRNNHYEFVEVLSNYSKEAGIDVAYLVKIEGFLSLFEPTTINGTVSFQIPPNELLRFSHRVPSFRTTGREREDVPEGYFELDPASLPNNFEETSEPVDVTIVNDSSESPAEESPHPLRKRKNPDERITLDGGNWSPWLSNWCHKKKRSASYRGKAHTGSTFGREIAVTSQADANEMGSNVLNTNTDIVAVHSPSSPSQLNPCEIPEAEFYNFEQSPSSPFQLNPYESPVAEFNNFEQSPSSPFQLNPYESPVAEFYNFEDDKTPEKFKPGQIWAVYCNVDDLPKYFVLIKRVELSPDFKLHIKWLKSCALPEGVIEWLDKDMPICCGTFESGESSEFDDTAYFSHQSRGVPAGKKNKYEIYPRKGEVWALYRNFNSEWSCSDLRKCEYDMVEVLEDQDRWTIVMVLQQFSSRLETVFMAKRKAGHLFIMAIPRFDLSRFSHQVPAFRMTEERYGSLRGCWVLDPKSMPVYLFSSK